jgi:hypothetical protein
MDAAFGCYRKGQGFVFKDRGFNKTRNLILERAAVPHVPKLKTWF